MLPVYYYVYSRLFLSKIACNVVSFDEPLIHISLASFYGTKANSADTDQTPQKAASGQGSTVCLQNVLLKYE